MNSKGREVGAKAGKEYVAGVDVWADRGPKGGLHGFHVKRFRYYGGIEFGLTVVEAKSLVRKLTKELKKR